MFLGREKELAYLEEKYQSTKAEFVVLYGRRRVGKTELLKEFCKDKDALFYSCTECTDLQQLSNFSTLILKKESQLSRYITTFESWSMAFQAIADMAMESKGKKLLIIDEFPYMCKGNASIPSILQNLWDNHLKNSNIMIIVCGSALSFIEKELLSEKNPLYGRATGIYKLLELDFYEMKNFFPGYSPDDLVRTYAILGGIPHYLNQFDGEKSVEWNIKNNILKRGCVLYNEVEFLMHQELRETVVYNAILENIAAGVTKLGEISDKSLIGSTAKTSVYLKTLQELSLVEKYVSVEENSKGKANRNRGLYRLCDNFFRFWYAFVFPNFSMLETSEIDGIYKYIIAPRLQDYCSLAFEQICQRYLQMKNSKEQLPCFYKGLTNWWGKAKIFDEKDGLEKITTQETELDILGIAYDKSSYLVGECKFMTRPFRFSEYLQVKNKMVDLQEQKLFYYYLFSASGFEEKLRELEHITLVDIDEVVNGI